MILSCLYSLLSISLSLSVFHAKYNINNIDNIFNKYLGIFCFANLYSMDFITMIANISIINDRIYNIICDYLFDVRFHTMFCLKQIFYYN